MVFTEDGSVKTWGWGEHGQLGLGNTCDQVLPQDVPLVIHVESNHHASRCKVHCGSGFTLAMRACP